MRDDIYYVNIQAERLRQNKKWGEQNHPDVDPVLFNRPGGASPERIAAHLEIPSANRARYLCDTAKKRGETTWSGILVEEIAEAVEAASMANYDALRTELIQVAAVAIAWLEALDRRAAR